RELRVAALHEELLVVVRALDRVAVGHADAVDLEKRAQLTHQRSFMRAGPAAKLRPVEPRTTTRPPVMYSQPWSPTPSTTALAPELRTAKRSPARPRKNALPLVAPYSTVLPISTFSSAAKVTPSGGITASVPPDRPLPV